MPRKLSEEIKEEIRTLHSQGVHVKEIAEQTGVSYSSVWGITKLTEKGFKTYGEYLEHLAQQKGFKTYSEYQVHLAQQRINPETGQAYASRTEYQEHLAQQRQKHPKNKELSGLINLKLEELGRNQSWLAEQLGVSGQTVSQYIQGKSIPSEKIRNKLSSVLKIGKRKLEDIIENSD
ncbi:MAG: helix-turn-helix domain-containing protein [Nanoarchaeota archaeon]